MNWHYPALMVLAIAAGVLISRRTQARLGLAPSERIGIVLGAFCGAMIGAKLPFVLADWNGLLSGAAWFANGKTIVFGLVGGYIGVEMAKWSMDVHIKTGDSFAVPVAASIAIGRLACFSAGCCYGARTSRPWGVDFGDGIPRHPTQLYESAFHFTAALVLAVLARRKVFPGQLFKLYLLSYLCYRFLTEFIRPEPALWLGLSGYQFATLVLMPVVVWLWVRDAQAQRRPAASTA